MYDDVSLCSVKENVFDQKLTAVGSSGVSVPSDSMDMPIVKLKSRTLCCPARPLVDNEGGDEEELVSHEMTCDCKGKNGNVTSSFPRYTLSATVSTRALHEYDTVVQLVMFVLPLSLVMLSVEFVLSTGVVQLTSAVVSLQSGMM